jgi:hypothetical protein
MAERNPGWGYRTIDGHKHHYSDDMKTPICNSHMDVSYECEPWVNPHDRPDFCCRACQRKLAKRFYNAKLREMDAIEIICEGNRNYECPICHNVIYPATFPGFGYCPDCRRDYRLPPNCKNSE